MANWTASGEQIFSLIRDLEVPEKHDHFGKLGLLLSLFVALSTIVARLVEEVPKYQTRNDIQLILIISTDALAFWL